MSSNAITKTVIRLHIFERSEEKPNSGAYYAKVTGPSTNGTLYSHITDLATPYYPSTYNFPEHTFVFNLKQCKACYRFPIEGLIDNATNHTSRISNRYLFASSGISALNPTIDSLYNGHSSLSSLRVDIYETATPASVLLSYGDMQTDHSQTQHPPVISPLDTLVGSFLLSTHDRTGYQIHHVFHPTTNLHMGKVLLLYYPIIPSFLAVLPPRLPESKKLLGLFQMNRQITKEQEKACHQWINMMFIEKFTKRIVLDLDLSTDFKSMASYFTNPTFRVYFLQALSDYMLKGNAIENSTPNPSTPYWRQQYIAAHTKSPSKGKNKMGQKLFTSSPRHHTSESPSSSKPRSPQAGAHPSGTPTHADGHTPSPSSPMSSHDAFQAPRIFPVFQPTKVHRQCARILLTLLGLCAIGSNDDRLLYHLLMYSTCFGYDATLPTVFKRNALQVKRRDVDNDTGFYGKFSYYNKDGSNADTTSSQLIDDQLVLRITATDDKLDINPKVSASSNSPQDVFFNTFLHTVQGYQEYKKSKFWSRILEEVMTMYADYCDYHQTTSHMSSKRMTFFQKSSLHASTSLSAANSSSTQTHSMQQHAVPSTVNEVPPGCLALPSSISSLGSSFRVQSSRTTDSTTVPPPPQRAMTISSISYAIDNALHSVIHESNLNHLREQCYQPLVFDADDGIAREEHRHKSSMLHSDSSLHHRGSVVGVNITRSSKTPPSSSTSHKANSLERRDSFFRRGSLLQSTSRTHSTHPNSTNNSGADTNGFRSSMSDMSSFGSHLHSRSHPNSTQQHGSEQSITISGSTAGSHGPIEDDGDFDLTKSSHNCWLFSLICIQLQHAHSRYARDKEQGSHTDTFPTSTSSLPSFPKSLSMASLETPATDVDIFTALQLDRSDFLQDVDDSHDDRLSHLTRIVSMDLLHDIPHGPRQTQTSIDRHNLKVLLEKGQIRNIVGKVVGNKTLTLNDASQAAIGYLNYHIRRSILKPSPLHNDLDYVIPTAAQYYTYRVQSLVASLAGINCSNYSFFDPHLFTDRASGFSSDDRPFSQQQRDLMHIIQRVVSMMMMCGVSTSDIDTFLNALYIDDDISKLMDRWWFVQLQLIESYLPSLAPKQSVLFDGNIEQLQSLSLHKNSYFWTISDPNNAHFAFIMSKQQDEHIMAFPSQISLIAPRPTWFEEYPQFEPEEHQNTNLYELSLTQVNDNIHQYVDYGYHHDDVGHDDLIQDYHINSPTNRQLFTQTPRVGPTLSTAPMSSAVSMNQLSADPELATPRLSGHKHNQVGILSINSIRDTFSLDGYMNSTLPAESRIPTNPS